MGRGGQVPSRFFPPFPSTWALRRGLGEPSILALFQLIPWAPSSGVQNLKERLFEKPGPLPTHQSVLSSRREQGRLRPEVSLPHFSRLTFHTVSASPGFSSASFQEEIRPPPFIRTPLPSTRHPPTPCFSCQLLGGEMRSGDHGFRQGWGPEAIEGTVAGVVRQEAGRWVQGWSGQRPPRTQASVGSHGLALPPSPTGGDHPTPTSHTHLGP